MRIGSGFDAHGLVAGRPLVLGGETIPFNQGLVGHSDADVVTHAICDALLGAAALGDLGAHFPSTDPAWKGVSSLDLLRRVRGLLEEAGWTIVNVDATIIAERPRLAAHLPAMRENISAAAGVLPTEVSIKATSSDGLGFTGRGDGIAAQAVALIERTR